jgi:hypothetical protein
MTGQMVESNEFRIQMKTLSTELMFIVDVKPKTPLTSTAVIKIKIPHFSLDMFTGATASKDSSPLCVNRSSMLWHASPALDS